MRDQIRNYQIYFKEKVLSLRDSLISAKILNSLILSHILISFYIFPCHMNFEKLPKNKSMSFIVAKITKGRRYLNFGTKPKIRISNKILLHKCQIGVQEMYRCHRSFRGLLTISEGWVFNQIIPQSLEGILTVH